MTAKLEYIFREKTLSMVKLMITAEQAIEIFKKEFKGYNGQKIVKILKVEGFGYQFITNPGFYTGPLVVNFNGLFKIMNVNIFDSNDPFVSAKSEVIFG